MHEQISSIYEDKRLLKAVDVADILNISRSLAYRLLQRGEIPAIRINQSVRVQPRDLQQFIEENRTGKEIFSIIE
ncbi:MAG: helix-turn-helix domain-containing protein [Anaerolineaceae bacterium]|nr:helix-turn-helix domain-containing protein [Anaerolineaceae bacterium]